jgi:hypothetical protein
MSVIAEYVVPLPLVVYVLFWTIMIGEASFGDAGTGTSNGNGRVAIDAATVLGVWLLPAAPTR